MKSIVSISLIVTFLLQYSMKWLVIINYEINKQYISNTYCQNKDKTDLHCDGKCYLLIELKKEEEKQSKLISFLKDNVELICDKETSFFTFLNSVIFIKYNSGSISQLQKGFLSDVFWPPASCSLT